MLTNTMRPSQNISVVVVSFRADPSSFCFRSMQSCNMTVLHRRRVLCISALLATRSWTVNLRKEKPQWCTRTFCHTNLLLGICGMHHRLFCGWVFSRFPPIITAIWWPQVLVWLDIFQLFSVTNISGKTKMFWTNLTVSHNFAGCSCRLACRASTRRCGFWLNTSSQGRLACLPTVTTHRRSSGSFSIHQIANVQSPNCKTTENKAGDSSPLRPRHKTSFGLQLICGFGCAMRFVTENTKQMWPFSSGFL